MRLLGISGLDVYKRQIKARQKAGQFFYIFDPFEPLEPPKEAEERIFVSNE